MVIQERIRTMSKNISLSLAAVLASLSLAQAPKAEAISNPPGLIAAKPAAQSSGTAKGFSGNVSWYGPGFNGKKTASGKLFDMNKCTSAHLHLPFFTKVLVEDPSRVSQL